MKTKLIIREFTVIKRKMTIAVEVHCQMERPSARAPRIELVFTNDYDDRRMVLPCQSFLPKTLADNQDPDKEKREDGKEGGLADIWIARARYSYQLRPLFWYGTWEQCRLSFDIDFDGESYQSVPFEMQLRKTDLPVNPSEDEDSEDGDSAETGEEVEEEAPETNDADRYEYGEREITIISGVPITNRPPGQPGRIQVILALLLRFFNALFSLLFVPWYIIDSIAIILLPTEEKTPGFNGYGFFGKLYRYVLARYFSFCRRARGTTDTKISFIKMVYRTSHAFHPRKKNILFLTSRRSDLTGNFKYIQPYLKKNPKLKLDYWMNANLFGDLTLWDLFSVAWKCGKAKAILLDEYSFYIRGLNISDQTIIFQIWHACGAFKVSAFSRLGKKGGTKQKAKSHRDYSYCFVTSESAAKYYQEGFGLSGRKVIPLGTPKTDIYLDDQVKDQVRSKLYKDYPILDGKKVLLFAPTYRGVGKYDAHYDKEAFDPNRIAENLSPDDLLVIHHHPFVSQPYEIRPDLADRILDLSGEAELEDLLFITDVLITDYSSIIYDASLLAIPMVFYAWDLEDYIYDRGFYFEYETNVPGKIVYSQEELIKALKEKDFEQEKVEPFCNKNFDIRDGKASQRVAAFIEDIVLNKMPVG